MVFVVEGDEAENEKKTRLVLAVAMILSES
jgi:hypothetical protein